MREKIRQIILEFREDAAECADQILALSTEGVEVTKECPPFYEGDTCYKQGCISWVYPCSGKIKHPLPISEEHEMFKEIIKESVYCNNSPHCKDCVVLKVLTTSDGGLVGLKEPK